MPAPIGLPVNIRTSWAVDVQISDSTTLYFTNGPQDVVFNNHTYVSTPILAGVGRIPSNIKASDTSYAITFVGIDVQFKQQLLTLADNGLNGRPVNCYRVFYDQNWVLLRAPLLRASGVIDTFNISDNYPETPGSNEAVSFNVTLSIRGLRDILQNRIAGVFTNDASHKALIDPTDNCMSIIPSLRDVSLILGGEPRSVVSTTTTNPDPVNIPASDAP